MNLSLIVIIVLVSCLFIYVFYLVNVYIKLENRRSLILTKFEEVDRLILEKLDVIKDLDDPAVSEIRLSLLNSINVNDKIRLNKVLDSLLDNINIEDKKNKKIINNVNDINNKINYSKEIYNDCLYEYNLLLNTIGGAFFKKVFKYIEYNTF